MSRVLSPISPADHSWKETLRAGFLPTASTIISTVGPVRGVLFFDVTRSQYRDYPAKFYRYDPDLSTLLAPYCHEISVIGSFGYGIEFFIFGLPVHIEFVKRLEWSSLSNAFGFSATGRFIANFWIEYDF